MRNRNALAVKNIASVRKGSPLSPASPHRFEPAVVRDGEKRVKVTRRAAPPAVKALPPASRDAVEVYAATAEAVAAGGVSTGASGGGGGGTAEGRQFHAMRHVDFLRRLDDAVGASSVCLARRPKPVLVPVLDIWRALAVEGLTVTGFLASRGLARNGAREAFCRDAFAAAAARVAAIMGEGCDPWAER